MKASDYLTGVYAGGLANAAFAAILISEVDELTFRQHWPWLFAWIAAWTVGCALYALAPLAALWFPTEPARIRRRLRAVEREREVLRLRTQLERAEATYRTEFDRYVAVEPDADQPLRDALAALEARRGRR